MAEKWWEREAREHLGKPSLRPKTTFGGMPVTRQSESKGESHVSKSHNVKPEAGYDFTEHYYGEETVPLFESHGTTRKSCEHNGTVLVWEREGRKFYGSRGYAIDLERTDANLIIDCAGVVKGPSNKLPFLRGPERFMGLNEYMKKLPDVITLEWRDQQAPPVTLKFWRELFALLPQGKIIVSCVGSHGRTGTTLAALLVAVGDMSSYEAIKHVREHHCAKAVENSTQERYLDNLSREAGTYEPWEYRDGKEKGKKDKGKEKGKEKAPF